jgi:hypothetical protein
MYPSEHNEQKTLVEWVAWNTGQHPELSLLYAVPNGGYRMEQTGARLKSEGVKAGVPDLCLPVARQGFHGLFIELKARHGTLKPTQQAWLAALNEQGYLAVVCWGADEAIATIKDYLGMG